MNDLEKCKTIKKAIEKRTGFLDIGVNSRKRIYIDLRMIYCKLCKTLTKAPLSTIAFVLRPNFNHATVLHSLKTFDDFESINQVSFIKTYTEVKDELTPLLIKDKIPNIEGIPKNEIIKFLEWFKNQKIDTSKISSYSIVDFYISQL